MSPPGRYFSMKGLAASGMRAYFLMAAFDSGTRVKTLPELKSRSFNFMRARMSSSELKATA